jgi:shikimate kinase
LYGYETCSFTLREDNSSRVFETRLLKTVFEPKREEVWDTGGGCIIRSFIIYTLDQILG